MGRRKKRNQRDEGSNANADQIPEKDKELVQRLKDIFNRSEQEIYLTLRECNMNEELATDRLLAEGKDKESSEVAEFVLNLKKLVNCSEEKIQEVFRECNMDVNEAVNRLLSQDNIPEDKREIVQTLMNIVNGLEQEIYAVLLDCNMDADKAVDRLFQDIVDNMKEVVNCSEQDIQAMLLECKMDSDEAVNRLLHRSYDHQQGSGNKFDSDGKETSNVQGIHKHLADSSTTSDHLACKPPLNSDASDVNTNKKPISLSEAVPSLSVSSPLGRGANDKRTMVDSASPKENVTKSPEKLDVPNQYSAAKRCYADILKMGLASSKENVTHPRPSSQLLNAVVAPVEQNLQRESINTFVQAMRQQKDPQYSASSLNQSLPSVSSLTEINEQAISHHYSLPEVPFTVGSYGSAPGSTIGSAHSSTYPSSSGSTYGSTNSSSYSDAAYCPSMWSDDPVYLRHESDHDLTSRLANNLASLFQKKENLNVRDPQGNNNSGDNVYRLFGENHDQNQQSPSFTHIQPHHSPSFIPSQPQQQQYQIQSFILSQPQQQQQQYQSPSFIPIQPEMLQQWNDQLRYNQPQQLQHQNYQFRYNQPQQLQYQNHQFRSYFEPQQLQHQNHQFRSDFQPQQLQYQNRRPSRFGPIQQQQQQQQQELQQHQQQEQQNSISDPSKQTQKEPGPRNNSE